MTRLIGIAVLIVITCISAGCITYDDQGMGDRIPVAVTIPPMKEMVEAIGQDRVRVTIVVPPGSEPHTFEPTPGQITTISGSKIFFRIGEGLLPFEDRLVGRLSSLNPDLVFVDLSEGIERIREDESHDHGGYDPHIWLSLQSGSHMAKSIASALIAIDPAEEAAYQKNLHEYLTSIDETNKQVMEGLKELRIRRFIVTHDAWGYFARDYNLEQIAVHVGGKEPTAREIQEIIMLAREDQIRVVFVEPQFSKKPAEVIAEEIGGVVVEIDPLAEAYLQNFIHIAEEIERAMR
ncbi:MAG: zinc ABC transporter substrate-binding protein [Methanocalculus sp.]|uniref:metal ABC transporter solute-binding protein, Zn/Mn family n=1 Tax=Methanocalculus sp. TaxID=2004547 RepID=UPI002715A133|nr:zinc ABC transporter substrate-binding protein [Methanocalculus sp.]MDO9540299.1 zinc ABC transporter substrate-binding protein [Methanocalculus sp.]